MDYKTEGDQHLKDGRYKEYYDSYKKYHGEIQTETSTNELRHAKKKYDLYKELCDFLKKDETKYYEILNLKKDATQKEIRDSYTKMMSKFHPDKTKIKESNSVSRILHKAYVILSNEKKRREYDDSLEGCPFRMGKWDYQEQIFTNRNYQEQIFTNRNYQEQIFTNRFYQGDIFTSRFHADEYTILNNILYRHFYRYTPNRRLERMRWDDQVLPKLVVLILLGYLIFFV